MTQSGACPPDIPASAEETAAIVKLKAELGSRLAILAHHYQNDSVVRHADFLGDSLELSRRVPGLKAQYIVFCGVYFMAESAAILASQSQQVYIPDVEASCVMSDMAPEDLVEEVVSKLDTTGRKVVPLTYVNSSAGVKAVCGAHDGSVCTSANARIMMQWALDRGDAVLFLPDRNLAMNTADQLGIPQDQRLTLDISGFGSKLDLETAAAAKLMVWPGMCVIHHRFKPAMIAAARDRDPGCLVAVHPECSPAVVAAADGAGSTSYLIKYVQDAPLGSTIYIGTEVNLVRRLAKQFEGRKAIKSLLDSGCANMAKITEAKLARQLQSIALGQEESVRVPAEIAQPALIALNRMLEACK